MKLARPTTKRIEDYVMVDDHQKLQTAFLLHQNGRLNEAANLYRQLIKKNKKNYHALHFLGVIEAGAGNIEQAKLLLTRSLSIQPPNVQFMENYAAVLFQAGDYKSALNVCQQGLQLNDANTSLLYVCAISLFKLSKWQESIAQFDKLLLIEPNHIAALNERGSVLSGMKQYDAALASVEKALILNPQYAEAHLNKGNICSELKRYDDGIAAYDRALTLKHDLAEAWRGRGNVLVELKRHDEAIIAYDTLLSLKPDFVKARLWRGNVYYKLRRYVEALGDYDKALAQNSELAEAWLGRGNVLNEFKRHNEAIVAYDMALSLKSDLAEAWLGRGNVFYELKRYDETISAYDKALTLQPGLAEVWFNRGIVFGKLKRHEEAIAAYDKALTLKPDLTEAEGFRLQAKMRLCDWSNYDAACAHLLSSVRDRKLNAVPFILLTIPSLSKDQLQYAKQWVANRAPFSEKPIWRGERYKHDRIRIAYLSADFRQHAVASVIAGMFECHDKSRFDVTAISFGPDDNSEMRQRLKASFEHFIDGNTFSDDQVAGLVKEAEIDIVVDLMGFTDDSRTNIFARRPAPIQINYLGYIGTMGAEYIDYIVADRIVIPQTQYDLYAEKIAYLPNSFQPTDRQRRISDKIFTRAEVGLSREGYVFCCFNNNYKITPDIYNIWMRILKQVNGSILWLVSESPAIERNLRKEAFARGVNADRLIFAPRMPLPEHQARLRLADLFLDTLPYNAGATASDALWAGLPVLTRIGDTFVGRMAASLLNAIHLPELITTTPAAYEQMAIELATHPEKMAVIKRKLAENRLTAPLFDTKLFTKHIEAAYTAMYERHQAGLAPDHIVIPN